jgi:hypothetical protein
MQPSIAGKIFLNGEFKPQGSQKSYLANSVKYLPFYQSYPFFNFSLLFCFIEYSGTISGVIMIRYLQ